MSDTLMVTLILVLYPDLVSLMSDTLVVTLILVVYPDLGSLVSDTLVVTLILVVPGLSSLMSDILAVIFETNGIPCGA